MQQYPTPPRTEGDKFNCTNACPDWLDVSSGVGSRDHWSITDVVMPAWKDEPMARPRKPQSETTPPGTRGPRGRHLAVVPAQAAPVAPMAKTKVRSGVIPHLGITEKQERYCQGVTSGLSLSDAYRQAYNTQSMADHTIHTQACKMFVDPKITARIKEINREKEERRRMMAASDAAFALDVLRRMAEQADSDATKVRAAELVAKAAGVFTEQVEIADKRDKTEEELQEAIAARLSRLGMTGS